MYIDSNQPSQKLGVKYLDKIQMENTFPDCDTLLQRIDKQRDTLMRKRAAASDEPQWMAPAMYDNVYAILGGRGTGKSSVLLTVDHYLKMRSSANIRFPIITPEMIADKNCSILGWIMATAEPILDRLEKAICTEGQRAGTRLTGTGSESLNQRCQVDFFKDCRFQRENRLRTLYNELCEIIQGTPDTSRMAYEDAVDLRAAHSRRQYQLRRKLDDFWQLLTTAWAEVSKEQQGAGEESVQPMVILMFDDIDLVPERSMELLTVTFQFLSNINIILILTAAERVLEQVIYLKMVDRMIGSHHHSLLNHFYPVNGRPGTADEEADILRHTGLATPIQMMTEFYNKVIPPANRYHLRRYNTISERLRYSYSSVEQSFTAPQKDRVSQTIDEFLETQLLRLYEGSGPNRYSFLQNTSGGKPRFRQAYLAMFGNKNRNIANGCLEIMNAVNRVLDIYKKDAQGRRVFSAAQRNKAMEATMRHLLRALVLSKGGMNRYADETERLLRCGGSGMVYVDYARVIELYRDEYDETLKRQRNDGFQEERIKVDVPGDAMRESIVQPQNWHEKNEIHEQLTAVRQRGGTLMVMLFFIENILLIFDPERHEVHGYRELTELLNYDSGMPEISRRMHVKLFRDYRSVNEFLDESPMLLDYIGIYTCFDVFDIQSVRNYLQNAVGLQQNNWVQVWGKRLDMDSEWVHTLLLMLFVQHSGISLVNRSFLLNVNAEESCRILDLFSFGGHLNKVIRQAAQEFLQQPNLALYSHSKLNEFQSFYRNRVRTDNPQKQIPPFLKGMQFTKQTLCSISERFDLCREECRGKPEIIRQYIAYRWWMEDADPYVGAALPAPENHTWQTGLCNCIIAFVERIIDNIGNSLKLSPWSILLTADEINTLYQALMEMTDFTYALKRQKEILTNRLKRAMKKIEDETDPAPEKHYRISAEGFVKYLADLDAVLFHSSLPYSDVFLLTQMDNTQLFFQIISYLHFCEYNMEEQINCGIPLSAFLAMEVLMLETLQPYYLAARFEVALSHLYHSERVFLESSAPHRDMSPNERMLFKQYQELSNTSNRHTSTRHLRKLCERMQDVRKITAEQYPKYLEELE